MITAAALWHQPVSAQGVVSSSTVSQARCVNPRPDDQGAGAISRRSRDCKTISSSDAQIGGPPPRKLDGPLHPEISNAAGPATKYSYVVGIAYTTAGRSGVCTGTLLSTDLVLTAGHCGCGDPGSYRVTQQLRMNMPGFLPVQGNPILLDGQMCQRGAILPGYDLALLRLAKPAVIETEKVYAPVPPLIYTMRDELRFGAKLKIVGYGLTNDGNSGVRMEADVPIYSPDCAWRRYAAAGCAPFLEMILADTAVTAAKAVDTCKGDSGGPVFLIQQVPPPNDARGTIPYPVLIAVTSRPAPLPHFDESNHCGGGGIYTAIGRTDVISWLRRNGAINPEGM